MPEDANSSGTFYRMRFTISCFWIQNSFWLLDISLKLKDYAKYPVAFMAYYPSLVILKTDNIPVLTWLSPVIGVVAFYLLIQTTVLEGVESLLTNVVLDSTGVYSGHFFTYAKLHQPIGD